MNKYTEIKEVKDQMRELADKLEALEAEPKGDQAGDVWIMASGKTTIVDDQGGYTYTKDGYRVRSVVANDGEFREFLGTFDEVYILRSEVEREYFKRHLGILGTLTR